MTSAIAEVKELDGRKAYPYEFEVPSGDKYTITRSLKGKDQKNALKFAGDNAEEFAFWLVSFVVNKDEKAVVYDDLLEMELADVVALQEEVISGNSKKLKR